MKLQTEIVKLQFVELQLLGALSNHECYLADRWQIVRPLHCYWMYHHFFQIEMVRRRPGSKISLVEEYILLDVPPKVSHKKKFLFDMFGSNHNRRAKAGALPVKF